MLEKSRNFLVKNLIKKLTINRKNYQINRAKIPFANIFGNGLLVSKPDNI